MANPFPPHGQAGNVARGNLNEPFCTKRHVSGTNLYPNAILMLEGDRSSSNNVRSYRLGNVRFVPIADQVGRGRNVRFVSEGDF
jgi:hypothetical protein